MRRLRPFVMHRPATLAEAVEIAAGGEAAFLAGGTDVLVDMKAGRSASPALIDLKGIDGLDRIETDGGGVRIGALTRISALESHPVAADGFGALWEAAAVLAPPTVRRLATLGGNLGRSSPASDTAPALLVLDASIVIHGPAGERTVGIDDFHLGPGQNRLGPGEMVTRVDVPHPPPGTASAYRKFGKRGAGWDLAVSGVAVVVTLAGDGTVAAVRIALSSMAPTPMRAPAAEAYLAGRLPDEAALAEAARLAASEARPISDHRASAGYRRTLAAVLTRRTLTEVVAAAGGGR